MHISLLILIIYIFIGAVVGLLSGLFGIGGGIILVPALVWTFAHIEHFNPHIIMHLAVGTSLGAIVFITLISSLTHSMAANVRWPLYYSLLPGMVIGVISGVIVGSLLPTFILSAVFGLFVLFVGYRMFRLKKPNAKSKQMKSWLNIIVAYLIGIKSGLLGLGGGTLLIPYLTHYDLNMYEASGTTSMCSFTIAITGVITMILRGWHHPYLPNYALGFVYWPAAIGIAISSVFSVRAGIHYARRLNSDLLKRSFSIILFLIGVHMILPFL